MAWLLLLVETMYPKLDPKDDKRFIVEGVCEGIILHNKEQNFATVSRTEDYIPMTQTIIDP